jgi:acetyltransferase-like isoleucine patch superfamily enzyme
LKIRQIIILFTGLLPASSFKNKSLRFLGWRVSSGVKIGPSIFLATKLVHIEKNMTIRPFSVFRNVSLDLGENSIVGSWNWISAAKGLEELPQFKGRLVLGRNSAINSRNYFDVSGGVTFGSFSDLAGVRSTFITHQIDLQQSIQTCAEIQIGNHTMICSNSLLVPGGTQIGNECLFAMGSLIRAGDYPSGGFYAGAPAVFKKQTSGAWFTRKIGNV